MTPEEKLKEEKRQRRKEARKNRRRIIISFSPKRTACSYDKFTTHELLAARDILQLAIDHRTKGLAMEPANPRTGKQKSFIDTKLQPKKRKTHPNEDQFKKGKMVTPKTVPTYYKGKKTAAKKK